MVEASVKRPKVGALDGINYCELVLKPLPMKKERDGEYFPKIKEQKHRQRVDHQRSCKQEAVNLLPETEKESSFSSECDDSYTEDLRELQVRRLALNRTLELMRKKKALEEASRDNGTVEIKPKAIKKDPKYPDRPLYVPSAAGKRNMSRPDGQGKQEDGNGSKEIPPSDFRPEAMVKSQEFRSRRRNNIGQDNYVGTPKVLQDEGSPYNESKGRHVRWKEVLTTVVDISSCPPPKYPAVNPKMPPKILKKKKTDKTDLKLKATDPKTSPEETDPEETDELPFFDETTFEHYLVIPDEDDEEGDLFPEKDIAPLLLTSPMAPDQILNLQPKPHPVENQVFYHVSEKRNYRSDAPENNLRRLLGLPTSSPAPDAPSADYSRALSVQIAPPSYLPLYHPLSAVQASCSWDTVQKSSSYIRSMEDQYSACSPNPLQKKVFGCPPKPEVSQKNSLFLESDVTPLSETYYNIRRGGDNATPLSETYYNNGRGGDNITPLSETYYNNGRGGENITPLSETYYNIGQGGDKYHSFKCNGEVTPLSETYVSRGNNGVDPSLENYIKQRNDDFTRFSETYTKQRTDESTRFSDTYIKHRGDHVNSLNEAQYNMQKRRHGEVTHVNEAQCDMQQRRYGEVTHVNEAQCDMQQRRYGEVTHVNEAQCDMQQRRYGEVTHVNEAQCDMQQRRYGEVTHVNEAQCDMQQRRHGEVTHVNEAQCDMQQRRYGEVTHVNEAQSNMQQRHHVQVTHENEAHCDMQQRRHVQVTHVNEAQCGMQQRHYGEVTHVNEAQCNVPQRHYGEVTHENEAHCDMQQRRHGEVTHVNEPHYNKQHRRHGDVIPGNEARYKQQQQQQHNLDVTPLKETYMMQGNSDATHVNEAHFNMEPRRHGDVIPGNEAHYYKQQQHHRDVTPLKETYMMQGNSDATHVNEAHFNMERRRHGCVTPVNEAHCSVQCHHSDVTPLSKTCKNQGSSGVTHVSEAGMQQHGVATAYYANQPSRSVLSQPSRSVLSENRFVSSDRSWDGVPTSAIPSRPVLSKSYCLPSSTVMTDFEKCRSSLFDMNRVVCRSPPPGFAPICGHVHSRT